MGCWEKRDDSGLRCDRERNLPTRKRQTGKVGDGWRGVLEFGSLKVARSLRTLGAGKLLEGDKCSGPPLHTTMVHMGALRQQGFAHSVFAGI
jgi:hypothetical protein